MLTSYKAKIVNNRVIWLENVPKDIHNKESVIVLVNKDNNENKMNDSEKKKVLKKLDRLAAKIHDSNIDDPIEWQHEIRKDTKLPNRN